MSLSLFCLPILWLFQATPTPTGPHTYASGRNDSIPGRFFVIGALQTMKSTHDNYFSGGSLCLSYPLTNRFALGVGVEYAYAGDHYDNGWYLANLRFLPLFMDTRFQLLHRKQATVFVHSAQGISFVRYQRNDTAASLPYGVDERGLYMYVGGGVRWQLTKHVMPQFEVGFKAFHVSRNELEVNPHGLTVTVAVAID